MSSAWRLVVPVLLLALVTLGWATPLDVCWRSVVSSLVDGCPNFGVPGNGSASAAGNKTTVFLQLVRRCYEDDAGKNVTVLAPNMSFTAYVAAKGTSAALATVLADPAFAPFDTSVHPLSFTLTRMIYWGRTLAQIGRVPPALLGLANSSSPPEEYDGWMVDPIALADLYDSNQTMDLSQLVLEMPYRQQLEWVGIHQLFRGSVVVDEGTVSSLPLGGLVYQMYYRKDVLARHGLAPPVTWDDFLYVVQTVNGTDMNGDGQPDYGVCLQRPRYCFNGFSLAAIWSSFIQSEGTRQGAFFDPDTLTPLVNNSAMRRAMDTYAALRAFGPPDETTATCAPFNVHFTRGHCALTLSWGYQLKANLFMGFSAVRDNVGVALLPGSTQVLNRTTGQLVPCTSHEVCPFGEELPVGRDRVVRLVNRAPYLAVSTASAAISAKANAWHQTVLLDFFSYLTSRNVSWELVTSKDTELGPYRYEHFDPAYIGEWVGRGYPEPIIREFLDVMKRQLDSANVMVEVRTVQAYAYRRLLDVYATAISEGADVAAAMAGLAADLQAVYSPATNPRFETIRRLYRYSIGLGPWSPANSSSAASASSRSASSSKSGNSAAVTTAIVLSAVAVLLLAAGVGVAVYAARQRRRRLAAERGPTGHPGLGDDTTLVVSDVEGSTALWEAIAPVVMDVVFNLHHDCMRRTAVRFGGYESQTEGDSFIIAFHNAADAVQFSLAVQQALLEEPWPRELLAHEKCRPVWLARSGVGVPLDLPLESAAAAGTHRGGGMPYTGDGSRHGNGTPQAATPGSWAAGGGTTPASGGGGALQGGSPPKASGLRPNLRQVLAARLGSRRRVHSSGGDGGSGAAAAADGAAVAVGNGGPDGIATSTSGGCGDGSPLRQSLNGGPAAAMGAASSMTGSTAPPPPPPLSALPLSIDNVGEALRVFWREVPAHIADPALSGASGPARWQGVKAVFRPSISSRPPPFLPQPLPASLAAAATSPASPPAFNRSRSLPVNPMHNVTAHKPGDAASPRVTLASNAIVDYGSATDADGVGVSVVSGANADGVGVASLDGDADGAPRSLSDAVRGHSGTSASAVLPKRYSSGSAAPVPPLPPTVQAKEGSAAAATAAAEAAGAFKAGAGSMSLGRRLASAAAAASFGLSRSASAGTGRRAAGGADLAAAAPPPVLVLSATASGAPAAIAAVAAAAASPQQNAGSRWALAQRMLRLQSHTHPYLGAALPAGVGASGEEASHGVAPPPPPAPPCCTLVKRGLSVRIGMHTGVRQPQDLQYSDVAKRWKYSGEVLAAAKAVSDAANGGDVLIGTATRDRLDGDLLIKRCRMLYVGRHVLRGGDAAAAAAPTLAHPGPPPGPGSVTDLYALYSPRLLPRVALYRPPRTEICLGLSVMDAPLGRVSYGLLVCHGLSSLATGHDTAVVSEARSALRAISEDQLLACHGVPAAPAPPGGAGAVAGGAGAVVGAFRNPYHAILWALQAQEDLLRYPWSPELLSHEQFEAIVVPAAAADVLIGSRPGGGGGGGGAAESSAHLTPVATPTYAAAAAATTAAQRQGHLSGFARPSPVDGDSGTGGSVGASQTPGGGRLLSGVVAPPGGTASGEGGTELVATGAATTPAVLTPQSSAWASRNQMKGSNWSLASYDGGLGVGSGGGGTAGWPGSGASARLRQSAPGHAMQLQRQATATAAVVAAAAAAAAAAAVVASTAAAAPTGAEIASAPLASGAGAPSAPFDSACEVSNVDYEHDSATISASPAAAVATAAAPPPAPPLPLASLSPMPVQLLGKGPLAADGWAITEEEDAVRSQPPGASSTLTMAGMMPAVAAAATGATAAAGGGEGDMVLYRGPRIKGAISYGPLKASLDPLTGRVRYEGKAASYAAKMASYASVGMVVASVEAVEAGRAEDSEEDGDTPEGRRTGTGCGVGTPRAGVVSGDGGCGGGGSAAGETDRRSVPVRASAPALSRNVSFRDDPEGPSAAMAAAAAAAAAALLNLAPGGGGGGAAVLHRSRSVSLDTGADPVAQVAAALAANGMSLQLTSGPRVRRPPHALYHHQHNEHHHHHQHHHQQQQQQQQQPQQGMEDPEADGRSSNSGPLTAVGGGGGGSPGGSRFPSGYSTPFSGGSYTYAQNPLYGTPLKPESRAASRTARTMSNLNPDSRQASRTMMHQPSGFVTAAATAGGGASGAAAVSPEAAVRRLSRSSQPLTLMPADSHPAAANAAAGGSGPVSGLLLQPAFAGTTRWPGAGGSPPLAAVAWRNSMPGTAAGPGVAASVRGGSVGSPDGRRSTGSYSPRRGSMDVGSIAESEDPAGAPGESPERSRPRPWLGGSATAVASPFASSPSPSGRPPRPRPPSRPSVRELPPPSPPRTPSPLRVAAAAAPGAAAAAVLPPQHQSAPAPPTGSSQPSVVFQQVEAPCIDEDEAKRDAEAAAMMTAAAEDDDALTLPLPVPASMAASAAATVAAIPAATSGDPPATSRLMMDIGTDRGMAARPAGIRPARVSESAAAGPVASARGAAGLTSTGSGPAGPTAGVLSLLGRGADQRRSQLQRGNASGGRGFGSSNAVLRSSTSEDVAAVVAATAASCVAMAESPSPRQPPLDRSPITLPKGGGSPAPATHPAAAGGDAIGDSPPAPPGASVFEANGLVVLRRSYGGIAAAAASIAGRSTAAGVAAAASAFAAGRSSSLRQGDSASATAAAAAVAAAGRPSSLRQGDSTTDGAAAAVAAAAAFAAGRSSSLRQSDGVSAAAAFATGRSSFLRYGSHDALPPALPPADLLRQRQQQQLLMLQQRDSQRVFLGAAVSPSGTRGAAPAPLPSVQVLSHGAGGGSAHASLPPPPPASAAQPSGHHTYPLPYQPYGPQSNQHGGAGGSLKTELSPASAGGAGGGLGTSPPRLHPQPPPPPPPPPSYPAPPLNHISSWRSSTSGSFMSGSRMGAGGGGGGVGGGGSGALFGTSSRRSGLSAGQAPLQGRPSLGSSLASQANSRRWDAAAGTAQSGGSGGNAPYGTLLLGAYGSPAGVPAAAAGSGGGGVLIGGGGGGGGGGAWPMDPQPAVSQALAAVGLDEVSMMPMALKKRGYSQPLVVYLCRFASSARTFEVQQRLVKMGHGDPTAAAAAAATAAAAAAVAAAEAAVGSGYGDFASLAGAAVAPPSDTGPASEASLAQLAMRDDGAAGSGTGGGGMASLTAGHGGGGGGSFLSERLDKRLSSMAGIFGVSRFGNDAAAAAGQHPHPHQHQGALPAAAMRRSSLTGLYPPRVVTPPELSRRSLGGPPTGEMTLAVHGVPTASGGAAAGRAAVAAAAALHGRAISCAGAAGARPVGTRGGAGPSSAARGGSSGGGFMRRFRRASLDTAPQKRRSDRSAAAAMAASGMLGSYGIGRPMGEVRTMSVKRVQRGTTSGPLLALALPGGMTPAAAASAILPTIHQLHHGVGGGGGGATGAGPYDALYGGATQQHRGAPHGATGPLLSVGAGGIGVVQRALFRSTAGAAVGSGAAGGACGPGGATSHGGSSDDSPRGTAAVGAAVSDALATPSGASGPCGSINLSSQPLFILGYGNNGGVACDAGSGWEYGIRPGGLVSRAPALMAPTEEGHETDAEAEDDEGEG